MVAEHLRDNPPTESSCALRIAQNQGHIEIKASLTARTATAGTHVECRYHILQSGIAWVPAVAVPGRQRTLGFRYALILSESASQGQIRIGGIVAQVSPPIRIACTALPCARFAASRRATSRIFWMLTRNSRR